MSRRRLATTITVAALSGWSCSSTAPEVTPGVAAIVVSPASSTIELNAQLPLQAQVQDGSGAVVPDATITWTVEDPRIVSVSPTGIVTGLALGSSKVAANALGKSGLATITVARVPIAKVAVSPGRADIASGSTVQLSASALDGGGRILTDRSISWTTAHPGLATVNGGGMVTGVGVGTVTITASAEGVQGTATINVSPGAVATVTVSAPKNKLKAKTTMQLAATAKDGQGNTVPNQKFSWSSSNTNIATVDANGVVTGKRSGSVTISAQTTGGKGGSVQIDVN